MGRSACGKWKSGGRGVGRGGGGDLWQGGVYGIVSGVKKGVSKGGPGWWGWGEEMAVM